MSAQQHVPFPPSSCKIGATCGIHNASNQGSAVCGLWTMNVNIKLEWHWSDLQKSFQLVDTAQGLPALMDSASSRNNVLCGI